MLALNFLLHNIFNEANLYLMSNELSIMENAMHC